LEVAAPSTYHLVNKISPHGNIITSTTLTAEQQEAARASAVETKATKAAVDAEAEKNEQVELILS